MSTRNKLEFTAEDFTWLVSSTAKDSLTAAEAAEIANARLREMLAECPAVYRHRNGDWFAATQAWRDYPPENLPSHRARLVEIEPLDKP